MTGAYRLNADCIVHTVGPIYSGSREDAKLLEQCYKNSMDAAWECNCQTVAFPSISTGAYRFPLAKAAEIAINTILEYLEQDTCIEDVYMVCFDYNTMAAYNKVMRALGREVEEDY